MSANWFCKIDNREFGPCTSAQIQEFASVGTLKPADHVRAENADQWHLASQIKGLTFRSGAPLLVAEVATDSKPPLRVRLKTLLALGRTSLSKIEKQSLIRKARSVRSRLQNSAVQFWNRCRNAPLPQWLPRYRKYYVITAILSLAAATVAWSRLSNEPLLETNETPAVATSLPLSDAQSTPAENQSDKDPISQAPIDLFEDGGFPKRYLSDFVVFRDFIKSRRVRPHATYLIQNAYASHWREGVNGLREVSLRIGCRLRRPTATTDGLHGPYRHGNVFLNFSSGINVRYSMDDGSLSKIPERGSVAYYQDVPWTDVTVIVDDDSETAEQAYQLQMEIKDLTYEEVASWGYYNSQLLAEHHFDTVYLRSLDDAGGLMLPLPAYFPTEASWKAAEAELVSLRVIDKNGKEVANYRPPPVDE